MGEDRPNQHRLTKKLPFTAEWLDYIRGTPRSGITAPPERVAFNGTRCGKAITHDAISDARARKPRPRERIDSSELSQMLGITTDRFSNESD